MDGIAQGEGTIYYKDDSIMYEGDFVNGNEEGNGKYFSKDHDYYIGEWSKGKKHGNGIILSEKGEIKYEGRFINDRPRVCIIF